MKPNSAVQPQNQELNTTLSTHEINGNAIPLTIFTPVDNGQAANNVPIVDMSPKVNTSLGELSFDEFMKLYHKFESESNQNVAFVTANVIKKDIIQGKEILDKESKQPLIGGDGMVRRYPDRFMITISGDGYTYEFSASEQFYNSVSLNVKYLFEGINGDVNVFGSVSFAPIFDKASPHVIPAPTAEDLTPEGYVAYFQRVRDSENTNYNIITPTILKKEIIEGKEILDKETRLPKLSHDGTPMRYPDKYSLSLIGYGFTRTMQCSFEIYSSVEVGTKYVFKGDNRDVVVFGEKKFSPFYSTVEPFVPSFVL